MNNPASDNLKPNEKLLPCPNCGGEAHDLSHFDGGHCYNVECMNPDCWVSTKTFLTKEESFKAWNSQNQPKPRRRNRWN